MPISRSLLLAATLTFTTMLSAQQSPAVIRVEGPPPQSAPSTAGNPDKAVRISGGVMAGQLVSRVDPVYPDTEAAGAVVLHAIIAPDGTVQQLSVISGPPPLQAAAVDAVRQWTYRPYLLNGNPVAVDTTIVVNFKR
jgi:protein TonB